MVRDSKREPIWSENISSSKSLSLFVCFSYNIIKSRLRRTKKRFKNYLILSNFLKSSDQTASVHTRARTHTHSVWTRIFLSSKHVYLHEKL